MVRTDDDEQDFTPEQLEATLEGEVVSPAMGMHGEVVGDLTLDPDALEEAAELEVAAARDAAGDDGDDDAEDPDAAATVDALAAIENEDDDTEAEPDLGTLLTGMLAPEVESDPEESDDIEAAGFDIDYVPTARRNEFVCRACFLIWNRRHLADAERSLCRDCIDDVAPVPPAAAA